ncbi:hypothetical protein [Lysobacter humi (ex Lee et al. 2017)]
MSSVVQILQTGWQRQPFLVALMAAVAMLVASTALTLAGPVAAALALLAATLAALGRLQWAVIDGSLLRIRDLGSGFVYRDAAAREFGRVEFRRTLLPHCRLQVEDRGAERPILVVQAPSPDCATLRALTLWMIVHGRRRARIDPALLDALAAMPEHAPASLPRDAHHA